MFVQPHLFDTGPKKSLETVRPAVNCGQEDTCAPDSFDSMLPSLEDLKVFVMDHGRISFDPPSNTGAAAKSSCKTAMKAAVDRIPAGSKLAS